MGNIFAKYRGLTFEQKIIIKTVISLCFSSALACGKFAIGLFSDYGLCVIAVYTLALLAAKLQCVLGAKAGGAGFKWRNALVSAFLLLSSAVYIGFMCAALFIPREKAERGLFYVLMLAFISFCELGFALAGIFRTKNRGHFYRDIKIINFCMALIAILTTQTAILDFMGTENTSTYNACTGIGIGVFIALCAVFISVAPKLSVVGREKNSFVLADAGKNKLVRGGGLELALCKSFVYGSYVYRAAFSNGRLNGEIVRTPSLWKRMNVVFKVLCCILSEILVFVWLAGRAALFVRAANLPGRLEKILKENGFEPCGAQTP